ncbi:hypothetical protein OEZ86_003994 [Tetradesmus obliquus]|nr:hypothetical protein OEZ86_003994 [Tetradesmus obliquus]
MKGFFNQVVDRSKQVATNVASNVQHLVEQNALGTPAGRHTGAGSPDKGQQQHDQPADGGLQARLAAMSEQQLRQKLVQLMARLGPMQAEIKESREVHAKLHAEASSLRGQLDTANRLLAAPDKPALDSALHNALQDLSDQNKHLTLQLAEAHDAQSSLKRHAAQLEDRLLSSQEQQQQQQARQPGAAAEEGMPSDAVAAKIAALQSELAASQAALLKLEQELTSHQYKVEVGSASSQDVVLLRGQLEAARSEAESAALQWAAEREGLVAAATDLYGEMQQTHAALAAAVAQQDLPELDSQCQRLKAALDHPPAAIATAAAAASAASTSQSSQQQQQQHKQLAAANERVKALESAAAATAAAAAGRDGTDGGAVGAAGAAELSVVVAELRSQLATATAAAAESHQANLTLGAELAVMERKQRNQAERLADMTDLQRNAEKMTARLEELQLELEAAAAEAEAARGQLAAAAADLAAAQADAEAARGQVAAVREEAAAIQADLSASEADYEDLRNQIEPMAALVQQLQQDKAQAAQREQQLQEKLIAAEAAAAAAKQAVHSGSEASTPVHGQLASFGSHGSASRSHMPTPFGSAAAAASVEAHRWLTASDSADAQESLSAELERSKASVARLLKERDDLEDKLKQVGKELKQAINEKSVQDIQLRDLNRTRAALNEAKEECARLRQQIALAHQLAGAEDEQQQQQQQRGPRASSTSLSVLSTPSGSAANTPRSGAEKGGAQPRLSHGHGKDGDALPGSVRDIARGMSANYEHQQHHQAMSLLNSVYAYAKLSDERLAVINRVKSRRAGSSRQGSVVSSIRKAGSVSSTGGHNTPPSATAAAAAAAAAGGSGGSLLATILQQRHVQQHQGHVHPHPHAHHPGLESVHEGAAVSSGTSSPRRIPASAAAALEELEALSVDASVGSRMSAEGMAAATAAIHHYLKSEVTSLVSKCADLEAELSTLRLLHSAKGQQQLEQQQQQQPAQLPTAAPGTPPAAPLSPLGPLAQASAAAAAAAGVAGGSATAAAAAAAPAAATAAVQHLMEQQQLELEAALKMLQDREEANQQVLSDAQRECAAVTAELQRVHAAYQQALEQQQQQQAGQEQQREPDTAAAAAASVQDDNQQQQQVNELQQQVQQLQAQLAAAEEAAAAKAAAAEADKQLLQAQLQAATDKLASAEKASVAAAAHALETASQLAAAAQAEVAGLALQLQTAVTDAKAAVAELRVSQEKLASAHEQQEQLQQQLAETASKLAVAEAAVAEAASSADHLASEAHAGAAETEQQLHSLRLELDKAQHDLESAKGDLASAEAARAAAAAEVEAARAAAADADTALASAREAQAAAAAEAATAKAQLAELRAALENAEAVKVVAAAEADAARSSESGRSSRG